MTDIKSTSGKRKIPFDQPIKMTLLFFHIVGFSVWYGGIMLGNSVPFLFPALTAVSGILLVARELFKDGFVWLVVSEGTLNIVKILLLLFVKVLKGYEGLIFSLVILCGLLSSHLPEKIREKRIL